MGWIFTNQTVPLTEISCCMRIKDSQSFSSKLTFRSDEAKERGLHAPPPDPSLGTVLGTAVKSLSSSSVPSILEGD